MSEDEALVEVIAIPVSKIQRDRYYLLAKRLKDIREIKDSSLKPKKITQVARESLDEMMDKVEAWINEQPGNAQ